MKRRKNKMNKILFSLMMFGLLGGTLTSKASAAGVNAEQPSAEDAYYRNEQVTAVKNQKDLGICWTFSAMAACEAELIQNNHADANLDLSELHLGYYAFHRYQDPLGQIKAVDSQMLEEGSWYNVGGNQYSVMNALASWAGAVTENEVPYEKGKIFGTTESKEEMETLAYSRDQYHLENSILLSKYNRTAIKQAILDYGGVIVSFSTDGGKMVGDKYYDTTNNSLYHYDSKDCDHEVLIVGWDDNFNTFNTQYKEQPDYESKYCPSGAGAWIVKNSWGDQRLDHGYFYMSYYDASIENWMMAYDMEPADKYDNNYQYESDLSGMIYTSSTQNASGEEAYDYMPVNRLKYKSANVFETKANPMGYEELNAVSFISYAPDARYSIQIYTDLEEESNPESGVLQDTIEGSYRYAGYHTIPTNEAIILTEGTRYAVVVEVKDQIGKPLGVSSQVGDYGFSDIQKAGCSFIYRNGTWVDQGKENQESPQIKAFTNNKEAPLPDTLNLEQSEIFVSTSDKEIYLKSIVTPEQAQYSPVIWSSSDENVATVSSKGKVTLRKEGTTTIQITSLNGLSAQCVVNIVDAPQGVAGGYQSEENRQELYWKKSVDADGYIIYGKTDEDSDYEVLEILNNADVKDCGNEVVYHPINVVSGFTYQLQITAFKDRKGKKIESEPSASIYYDAPLDTVQNIKATEITSESITFTWDYVEHAQGYQVVIDGEVISVAENTYKLEGLASATNYAIAVYAVGPTNSWNRVCTSEEVSYSEAYFTKYPKVKNLQSKDITSEGATIYWDAYKSSFYLDVEAFEIVNVDTNEVITVSAKENSYTFTELESDTKYHFAVRAKRIRTAEVEGILSDVLEFTTLHKHVFVEGVCTCGMTESEYAGLNLTAKCGEHLWEIGLPKRFKWVEEDIVLEAGASSQGQVIPKKVRFTSIGIEQGTTTEELTFSITVTHKAVAIPAVLADCEKDGSTSGKYCEACGLILEQPQVIKASGHHYDEGVIVQPATINTYGRKQFTCKECGETKEERIDKLVVATTKPDKPEFGKEENDQNENSNANVTQKNESTMKRPQNGEEIKDAKETGRYRITSLKLKEVAFIAPVNGKDKTVTVPASIERDGVIYRVTRIEDNAFTANKNLSKVSIGKNIKSIGKNVFAGCKKLKQIKICSKQLSSKKVAKKAFKGVGKKTMIKVPKKKYATYKKMFKKKGLSSKVKVKKY